MQSIYSTCQNTGTFNNMHTKNTQNPRKLDMKNVFRYPKDQDNIRKLVLQILRDRKGILEEMETKKS